jgi:nucleotide-binding universal stress UspA family protein
MLESGGRAVYRRILVPLDGSPLSEGALPYVQEIAANLGSDIVLITVSGSDLLTTGYPFSSYLEGVSQQVKRHIKELGPAKEVQVSTEAIEGEPATEIISYANRHSVDLIAMTSRGSSARGPWLLGNVAAKVLRASTRPLLLVRKTAMEYGPENKRLVKRILVPLDGSELGASAIPHGQGLCQALGAELVLFYAMEPEPARVVARGYDPYLTCLPPQALEEAQVGATAYLEGIAKLARDKNQNISTVVDFGSAALCIIDYAKRNSVDLIAMSTHGRTGISRWVFGSVTDKVLHAGDTAVLVVPAHEM